MRKKAFIAAPAISIILSLLTWVAIAIVFGVLFGISLKSCSDGTVKQRVDPAKSIELRGDMDLLNLLRTEHETFISGSKEKMTIAEMIIISNKLNDYSELRNFIEIHLEQVSTKNSVKAIEIKFPDRTESYGKKERENSLTSDISLPLPESEKFIHVRLYDSEIADYKKVWRYQR